MPCRLPKPLYDIVAPLVERHEGKRSHPYDDITGRTPVLASSGKITIGIGRNLTDRGLSEAEILYLFNNDLDIAYNDAQRAVGGAAAFGKLSLNRQAALIDMSLNLGLERLMGFRNTLLAVKEGRYNDAAAGMRSSKWAQQVGMRAQRLAQMMEAG